MSGAAEPIRRLVGEIDAYLVGLDGDGLNEVRAGIALWRHGALADVAPRTLPALGHLEQALTLLGADGYAALGEALRDASPHLAWTLYDLYPREAIGEAFADGHAYACLIGDGAPIPAEDFNLGIFIIAPGVFYRDHHHAAPELYAPLTGPHGWRFASDAPLLWKGAHEPVWNEPWRHHATKVGEAPFLCLFCWTRDVSIPAVVIASTDWADLEA